MLGRPAIVAHLFWTAIAGGGFALVFGRPALVATGLALAAILLWRLDRPRRFRALVRRTARRHARTLALRRRQERFIDAYGNLIEDGWIQERRYFAERTIRPVAESRGFADRVDPEWEAILAIIERTAQAVQLPEESAAPEDGLGYERFCATLLERAGWQASMTGGSGDQGADILAQKRGTRLVVQCKRYSKPVGNAAVQEAAAAGRHWSAHKAAVVSNAGFTPAARKLAGTTGVLLLHHDDLAELDLGRAPRRARAPA